jgi:arylsulfatase A-like enzyme/Tfp pilus assembly protein PilF
VLLPALLVAAAVQQPSLVLVTLDTVRADRLRCYGRATIETPACDRLAREGVLLEDATVQAPQTRPSHASLLTGRLPYEHGIRDNYSPPLEARVPTLATILKARGYRTAAFVGSYVLASLSGLDRGFEVYDDRFGESGQGSLYVRSERPGAEVVDAALAWLGRTAPAPLFAWLHLYDPHAPYAPPPPYDSRYAREPYDGEVAYADAQVGRLLEFLDAKGLRRDTLVVVTSDHGEGLGEHGEDEHLMFAYDSTLRVPLLLSWPGVLPAGARVAGQFRSIDLLPTTLELLGLPPVASRGASRAAELRAGRRLPDNESYAESLFGALHFGYAPLRALRSAGWKWIDLPRPELYDLREDPGETRNLSAARKSEAERLRAKLKTYDTTPAKPALAAPDAGVMERLAALGYVAGPGAGSSGGAPDPKDRIAEYQAYTRDVQQATGLSQQGKLEEALPILERLFESRVASQEVATLYGRVLVRKRRWAEAATAFEEAIALVPRFSAGYVELAEVYLRLGKLPEARGVLERGLRQEPGNAAMLGTLGLTLQRAGELPGAASALERAKARAGQEPRWRLALSSVYRAQGQREKALAELREAARLWPRNGDVQNALGVLLMEAGSWREAGAAFEKALAARADDPDALFNLARVRVETGQSEQAVALLERLVASRPRYPGAAQALQKARGQAQPLAPGSVELWLLRVASMDRAEEAVRRLAAGADGRALAREWSIDPTAGNGGALGVVRLEELAGPLRAAAAALAPGQLSAPIETPSGWVLLKRER